MLYVFGMKDYNFCRLGRGFLKAEMVATNTSVHPLGLRMLWPIS